MEGKKVGKVGNAIGLILALMILTLIGAGVLKIIIWMFS